MKSYQRADVVDRIQNVNDLLTVIAVSHENLANKDLVIMAVINFVQPELQSIINSLEIKEGD